jgi:hypothetical protein
MRGRWSQGGKVPGAEVAGSEWGWSQRAKILWKSRFCKVAGVSTPVWSKIGGIFLGFLPMGLGPSGGLAPCVAKPILRSPSGGLTRCGGISAVFKPSVRKTMGFESTNGQGARQEGQGAETPEQQVLQARPQGANMLGKGLGVQAPGIPSPVGSSRGSITWGCPQGRSFGDSLAPWVVKPLGVSPSIPRPGRPKLRCYKPMGYQSSEVKARGRRVPLSVA